MLMPDLDSFVPAANGTTLAGLVAYLIYRDVIKPKRFQAPSPSPTMADLATITANIAACQDGISRVEGFVKEIVQENRDARHRIGNEVQKLAVQVGVLEAQVRMIAQRSADAEV